MLVDAGAGSGLLGLGLLDLVVVTRAARRATRDLGFGDGLAHHFGPVVNRRLGAGFIKPLAGEPGFVHLGVGGDDHQIRRRDVLGGQGIFGPD